MGLRGPLRDPNSVRGQREAKRAARLALVENGPAQAQREETHQAGIPDAPAWLPREARRQYDQLVRELTDAKVPVKAIDAHAIAMTAQVLCAIQETDEISKDREADAALRIAALKLKGQYERDLKEWLQLICATPGSRARIGMKPPAEKKGGKLGELLAARMARQA